jgi:hypothetical protein
MDNDAYGHVNNVVYYYSWFDTVVNEFLIRRGVLDIARSAVIGIVAETHCSTSARWHSPKPSSLACASGIWVPRAFATRSAFFRERGCGKRAGPFCPRLRQP